ncbi:MAG: hypothetical protein R2939_05655 [Kofleriaceae bacterium]
MPCADGLVAPATEDSFGLVWDGLERTATTLAQATVDCESFGGRLPTATEVHRASAQQSGDVGETFDTAPLWTQVPADELTQVASRLSDGAASEVAASAATAYRCVCAPPGPPLFSGQRCSGPASAPCVAVGERNMDARDRPAMRHSSALWECAHDLGHVADPTTLIEASYAGVTGSNAFLQTSDRQRYDTSTAVRWSGTNPWSSVAFGGSGGYSSIDLEAAAPFRCVGPSVAYASHPNPVDGGFTPATGRHPRRRRPRGERMGRRPRRLHHRRRPPRTVRRDRRGALRRPRRRQRHRAVDRGSVRLQRSQLPRRHPALDRPRRSLPVPLRQRLGLERRVGVQARRGDGAVPVRLLPARPRLRRADHLRGGCFAVVLAGAEPGRMWFDSIDRPALALGPAVAACAAEGGRLASERDLTEAIRAELPGGMSMIERWTSEFGNTQVNTVLWTDGDTAFDDTSVGGWIGRDPPQTLRPYRCMWTNEVR